MNNQDPEIVLSIKGYCDACGAPVCQRSLTINLALGNDEELFCLSCLAKSYDKGKVEFFEGIWHYIENRDCFLDAWQKQSDPASCPIKGKCIFELCFPHQADSP